MERYLVCAKMFPRTGVPSSANQCQFHLLTRKKKTHEMCQVLVPQ